MRKPTVQAGYDYKRAVLELRATMTYKEISEYCGWDSKSTVNGILKGAIPSHPQGEALYILYTEVMNRKPT